jgi:uncharacterized membrane protein YqjE
MPEPTTDDAGFFRHFSALLSAKLAYLRARLQLAGIEGKEAAVHSAVILGLAAGGLIVLVFGYLFLIIGLVFLIALAMGGGNAWIWVLLGAALLHIAGAALLIFIAKSKLGTPLFPLTLDELKKDQEWLKTIAKPN